jgi:hypothetical protein
MRSPVVAWFKACDCTQRCWHTTVEFPAALLAPPTGTASAVDSIISSHAGCGRREVVVTASPEVTCEPLPSLNALGGGMLDEPGAEFPTDCAAQTAADPRDDSLVMPRHDPDFSAEPYVENRPWIARSEDREGREPSPAAPRWRGQASVSCLGRPRSVIRRSSGEPLIRRYPSR